MKLIPIKSTPPDQVIGQTLAEAVRDPESTEVILSKGRKIDLEDYVQMVRDLYGGFEDQSCDPEICVVD